MLSIKTEGTGTILNVDARAFSMDAVLRASYWMSDRLLVSAAFRDVNNIELNVKAVQHAPTLQTPRSPSLTELVEEFQTRLTDAELQVRINRETSAIRELIYAKAFSEAGILEDPAPGSFEDPVLQAQSRHSG
jgi:His-Xaa-Ser system protein HxsD